MLDSQIQARPNEPWAWCSVFLPPPASRGQLRQCCICSHPCAANDARLSRRAKQHLCLAGLWSAALAGPCWLRQTSLSMKPAAPTQTRASWCARAAAHLTSPELWWTLEGCEGSDPCLSMSGPLTPAPSQTPCAPSRMCLFLPAVTALLNSQARAGGQLYAGSHDWPAWKISCRHPEWHNVFGFGCRAMGALTTGNSKAALTAQVPSSSTSKSAEYRPF